MVDIEEEVEKLEKIIDESIVLIDKLNEKIKTLKNQSSIDKSTISNQEKELKDLENKLFDCNKQRKEIRDELDKRVLELEKSNLAKEEIAQQVIQLLTKSGFTEVRKKLYKTWNNYSKSKDSFNELKESLSISQLKAIYSLEETKRNLWIIIWVLLFAVILLSLSLSLSLSRYLSANISKKKKKTR